MTMATDRLYRYGKLPTGHIRLIKPSTDPAPFTSIDIVSCALDDPACPKFTALSYCWDGQVPCHEFQADGGILLVTTNILSVLSHIRTAQRAGQSEHPLLREKYYWIDALCINQSDSAEKSQQVSMMKRIYESAHCLVLWLGDPSSELMVARGDHPECLVSDDELRSEHVKRLFIEKPYWRRCWVAQEATTPAPPDGVFVCSGLSFLTRQALFDASRQTHDGATDTDLFDLLIKLADMRAAVGSDFVRLSDLLTQLYAWNASDRRDLIYALLPLTTDGPLIVPDYDQDTNAVFQKFAGELIIVTRNLNIMTRCERVLPHRFDRSWVPTWASLYDLAHPFPFPLPDLEPRPTLGVSTLPDPTVMSDADNHLREAGEIRVLGLPLQKQILKHDISLRARMYEGLPERFEVGWWLVVGATVPLQLTSAGALGCSSGEGNGVPYTLHGDLEHHHTDFFGWDIEKGDGPAYKVMRRTRGVPVRGESLLPFNDAITTPDNVIRSCCQLLAPGLRKCPWQGWESDQETIIQQWSSAWQDRYGQSAATELAMAMREQGLQRLIIR